MSAIGTLKTALLNLGYSQLSLNDQLYAFLTDQGHTQLSLQAKVKGYGGWNKLLFDFGAVIQNVSIVGVLEVGQVITADYEFFDAYGNPESGTTYQWYTAVDGSGTSQANIAGATLVSYTLTAAEENDYVAVGVTPLEGNEVFSFWVGPILPPPASEFVAIAHSTTPFVTAYNWNAGFGTKITNPTTLPTDGYLSDFYPGGSALAVSTSVSAPYVVVYPWSVSGFGTKVADPVSNPGAFVSSMDFTNGTNPALGMSTSGGQHPTVYPWTGAFGTKVSTANPIPSGLSTSNVEFHPAGGNLALGNDGTPFLYVYGWSGVVNGTASGPTSSLPSAPTCLAWNEAGTYLAAGISTSPFVHVHTFASNAIGSKSTDPGVALPGAATSLRFSPAGDYLAISTSQTPFINVYPWTTTFGAKVANPSTLPLGTARKVKFTDDGNYLIVSFLGGTPYVYAYAWSGGFGVKLADPSVVPAGNPGNVSYTKITP